MNWECFIADDDDDDDGLLPVGHKHHFAWDISAGVSILSAATKGDDGVFFGYDVPWLHPVIRIIHFFVISMKWKTTNSRQNKCFLFLYNLSELYLNFYFFLKEIKSTFIENIYNFKLFS